MTDRQTAIAIVAQQIVSEAWDYFVDQQWDNPQYNLSEYDWHAVLEEPFIFGAGWSEFDNALATLGGKLD